MMLAAFSVKRLWMTLMLLFLVNTALYAVVLRAPTQAALVMGSGKESAALIRSRHTLVLVNTGADAGILRFLGTRLPPWQRTIDAVVITSSASQQAGGLPFLLERYRVGAIIRLGSAGTPNEEAALARALHAAGDPRSLRVPYGAHLSVGSTAVAFLGSTLVAVRTQNKTLVVGSTTSVLLQ